MTVETSNREKPLPQLEQYEVLEKLAVGGMAAIFSAKRKGSNELCVIKALHDHYARDPVVGNRFLREAQVAALLSHPNIARLTDAKRENDHLFLAMELIAGHDMESMMFKLMEQRRMLPPGLTIRVAVQVMAGLHYAHEFRQGNEHLEIVHRDLSPRNVMIAYDGAVKIIDFGLARAKVGEFRTAPQMVLGTLRYMSPEQATAEPVDRRSDIYSFGTVIYEALTGRPFIRGNDAKEITNGILSVIPRPLSELNPDLPRALDIVLDKALQKNRRDRFDTADDFRLALLEAAPDLASTPDDQVGDFVRQLFPAEEAKIAAMTAAAGMSEEPTFEATRAGQLTDARADIPSPSITAPQIDDELAPHHYAQTATRPRMISAADHSGLLHAPDSTASKRNMFAVMAAITALAAVAVMTVFVVNARKTQSSSANNATTTVVNVAETARPQARVEARVEEPPPKKKRTTPRESAPPRRVKTAEQTPETVPPPPPPARGWKEALKATLDGDRVKAAHNIEVEAKKRLTGDKRDQVTNCTVLATSVNFHDPDAIRACYRQLVSAVGDEQ